MTDIGLYAITTPYLHFLIHNTMKNMLKKLVAVMGLSTLALAQIPAVLAFTISDAPSSGSNTYNPTFQVQDGKLCDYYGCSTGTGSTGSGSTGATSNVPTGQECNFYGCSGGSTGNGGTTYLPTNNVPANEYCDFYGCNGSNGNGSLPTNDTPPGQNCDYYPPCKKDVPGQVPGPQPGTNPQISACNNHRYPTDIDGHWAEIYIRRLYDLCILEGYSDYTYRPNQHVTRAELVKMALYAAGIKPNHGCYDNDCGSPFTDLDLWQGSWIRAAYDHNIVRGYSYNRFKPNRAITRAEATKVILAAYGYGPLSTSHSFFKDVSGWSTGWIERAHEMGIVQGIGNGNFDPNRPITRAEAAKIVAKTIEKWDTHIAGSYQYY